MVAAVTLVYWLGGRDGLYGLDDFLYARYAHQLATGTYHLPVDPQHLLHDPLRHRWAVFGPVAVAFQLGGINLVTATLWPLIATLGTTALLTALLIKYSPLAAAGATLALGLSQHTLWLATYLYGDNVAMLLALAAAAVPAVYRWGNGRHPVAWGVTFALANLAAWLSKETIVWYLPAYAWLALLDWRARANGRFWLAAGATGMLLLAGYFGLYALRTGDPWQRFHEIATTGRFLRSGNFGGRPTGALVARLTWEPVVMLAASGLGVLAWPAVLAAARPGWRDQLLLRGPRAAEGWWLLLALVSGVQWWLGSASLDFWDPLALNPRLLTPLLPPLAVLAGVALATWYHGSIKGIAMAAGFFVLAVLARNSLSALYVVVGSLAWWSGSPRQRRWRKASPFAVVTVLLGVLLVRPAYQFTKPTVSDWRAQQVLLRRYLAAARGPATVFTDDHLLATYPFWYGFQPPPALQWRPFGSGSDSLPAGQPAYLLLNEATLANADLPRLASTPAARVRTLFPHRRLVARQARVWLYEVQR